MVWPLVRLGTHSRNRAALEKRRAEKCSVSRRDEGPHCPYDSKQRGTEVLIYFQGTALTGPGYMK